MSTSTLTRYPRKARRLVFRQQGDQVLVYNATTDQLYLLQPRAAEILKQCDGSRSAGQLVADALAGEPRLAAQAGALVTRLFGQFEKRRLITWQTGEE